MKEGYLYIATGEKYIDEAVASVKSLKRLNRNVHATLITDDEVFINEFDNIIIQRSEVNNGWKEGIFYKVKGLMKSPYTKTFFIDTDTYFCSDCQELFELLDFNDLLIAHAPADTSQVIINEKILSGYYPYNTGVIVFKNSDDVMKLLKDWLRIYEEKFQIYPHDQTPFMESLLLNKVKHYVLQPIYNFRTPFLVSLPPLKVKIIHGRVSNFQTIEREINKNIRHRTWKPSSKKVIYPGSFIKKQLKRIRSRFK